MDTGKHYHYDRILDINIGEGTGHNFLKDFLLVSFEEQQVCSKSVNCESLLAESAPEL